jgi:hypothetical protein
MRNQSSSLGSILSLTTRFIKGCSRVRILWMPDAWCECIQILTGFNMLYPIINRVIMCVESKPGLIQPCVTLDTKRLRVLKDWDFFYTRELEDRKLECLVLHFEVPTWEFELLSGLICLLLRLDGSHVERLWQVFDTSSQLLVKGLSSSFFRSQAKWFSSNL